MNRIKWGWVALGILVPSIGLSQTLSIGAGGGSVFVLKSSYYTDPLGYPGIYYVNGVRSMFGGQDLGAAFQLATIAEVRFTEFPATISVGVEYAFLRGHGNTVRFYPLPSTESYPVEATTKVDLLSFSFGTTVHLINGTISPFLVLNVQLNHFGETSVRLDEPGWWSEVKTLDSYNRLGLGIGPGVDFSLLPGTTTRVTTVYNIYNVSGRNTGEAQMKSIGIKAVVLYRFSL